MECNKCDFIAMQFSMHDFSFFVHKRKYFLTGLCLHYILLLFTVMFWVGCKPHPDIHLFTALTASETGISFTGEFKHDLLNGVTI